MPVICVRSYVITFPGKILDCLVPLSNFMFLMVLNFNLVASAVMLFLL